MKTEIRECAHPGCERGRTKKTLRAATLPLTALAALLSTAAPARAVTCTVTSLADTGTGTLRDAIVNQACDTIVFRVTGTIGLAPPNPSAPPVLTINRDVTITGPGADVLQLQLQMQYTGYNRRLLAVAAGRTVAISGLTISSGMRGTGIYNFGSLTLSNSTVSGNAGEFAGGIENFGVLTLNNCKLSYNLGSGGGIANKVGTATINNSTISGNNSDYGGGGIDNFATLTLNNSTVSGNTAGEEGGGIRNRFGILIISNSTVSDNFTTTNGGGISNYGALTISNSTMSGNRTYAQDLGSGIYNDGTLKINDSIVVNSPTSSLDILGPIAAGEYNIIGSYNAGAVSATNLIGVDPKLGPLQNNGGPTMTHALLAGSPAIDGGDPNFNNPNLPWDQRGARFARVSGGRIDIGSFEHREPYPFTGFYRPVDNLPTVNSARAGSAIPVKFGLGGNRGLNIFAADSPSSQQIACDTFAPLTEVELTLTAGASGLSYELATDTYTYVWKTSTAWRNTCRQLIVKLNDNTTHVANFQFR